MRSSIDAQSCASVPPVPAWMSMKQLFGSSGLGNIRRNSRSATVAASAGDVVARPRRASRRRLRARASSNSSRRCRAGAVSSSAQRADDAVELLSFPCRAPARASGRPRSSGLRARASRPRSRAAFASKSKIPPQIGGAMLQIGELVGDLIEVFGFHWRSFPDPVSIVAIIPAAAPAPTREGARHVSHAHGNPL